MSLDFFTEGPLRTLLRVGGLDVVLQRGELQAELRLMPADQDNAAQGQHGYTRQWGERDWIGFLADYVLDGEATQPEVGDLILVGVVDGVPTETWMVSPGMNDHVWEPLASNRSGFRLHTVQR